MNLAHPTENKEFFSKSNLKKMISIKFNLTTLFLAVLLYLTCANDYYELNYGVNKNSYGITSPFKTNYLMATYTTKMNSLFECLIQCSINSTCLTAEFKNSYNCNLYSAIPNVYSDFIAYSSSKVYNKKLSKL